ncbi:LacI family DNA-binding transcriptional regulator [Roseospira visakhapatnamensis]|uniref:DNA-binding LacI/PurR family transcriptional regulator n=1 Tax=Roseospira visakhapatnamensis TaxID=390880 RepID=A0A7W6WAS0_9PROT|nr:LacI family DNA-binding transcriptional regulator [Roseospira visakhapatnamensis]MBB4267123.1 DNA-binding LacI/PurR family transcriptional regulator [Roseospira visakhapatnamensis]
MREKKKSAQGTRPVSIRGIAGITGFSTTTVSLVLNGRAGNFNISDETRDLILAKAKELNYQPNLHARNLRSGRSDVLGLTVPTLRNPFFGELAETFEAQARAERKLALIHVTQYERAEEISAIRYFLSQQADCIFVANPMALDEIAALCEGSSARQIFLDAQAAGRNTVSTDHFSAALELTRAIVASMARDGQRGRIYFFGGMADHQVTRIRLDGFKAALTEAGLGFSDAQVIWSPFDAERSCEVIRDHFATKDDTAGMFVNSIVPMEGLIRYFPENFDVCRSVHYGVFDSSPYLRLLTSLKIISVKQDSQGIMEAAFDLFRLGTSHSEKASIVVPHRLIGANACDPPPSPADAQEGRYTS